MKKKYMCLHMVEIEQVENDKWTNHLNNVRMTNAIHTHARARARTQLV